jgi:uncharacterized protein (DUF427 family)
VTRIELSPRRVRGVLAGRTVFDTLAARYVWSDRPFPHYWVPMADVDPAHLPLARLGRGELDGLAGFPWNALDEWYEEDERIFVHPRDPYVRVDSLRSSRHVRVSAGGVLLAETRRPVLVFETGLPTRYYVERTDVDWSHLEPSGTRTGCPYKGWTSGYWSAGSAHRDIAWAYDFPTAPLLPIAGMIGFYDERLEVTVA